MEEDEYVDAVDEADDYQDSALDIQDAQVDQYEQYPSGPKATENILTWFWKIVGLKDSTKVANLTDTEVGAAPLTVRGLQRLALVSQYLNEDGVQKFFKDDAEIVLATSMSRKGWLVEQSISTKKQTTRARTRSAGQQQWRLFQKKQATQNPTQ